jgi:hypothetical protein
LHVEVDEGIMPNWTVQNFATNHQEKMQTNFACLYELEIETCYYIHWKKFVVNNVS